jgi:hypothetical protein
MIRVRLLRDTLDALTELTEPVFLRQVTVNENVHCQAAGSLLHDVDHDKIFHLYSQGPLSIDRSQLDLVPVLFESVAHDHTHCAIEVSRRGKSLETNCVFGRRDFEGVGIKMHFKRLPRVYYLKL